MYRLMKAFIQGLRRSSARGTLRRDLTDLKSFLESEIARLKGKSRGVQ